MTRLLALSCRVSFTVFWVFATLSVLAFAMKHVLFSALAVIALLALAFGAWLRLQHAGKQRPQAEHSATAEETAQI